MSWLMKRSTLDTLQKGDKVEINTNDGKVRNVFCAIIMKRLKKRPKMLQIKSCRLKLTLRLKTLSPNFDSNNENKSLARWGGKDLSQVIPHVSSGSRILKGPQTLCHDLWGQQFKTIAFIIIWIEGDQQLHQLKLEQSIAKSYLDLYHIIYMMMK